MAEVDLVERCLYLRGLHLHGIDVGANALGVAVLRDIVQEVMEALDVDSIVVGGARRTSGAGPGRAPGRLRFTRKVSPRK
ncbi:hypothetical protein [Rhodoplanes roseus]|nr:hypothetical protein [Rhodoplanes roseus]